MGQNILSARIRENRGKVAAKKLRKNKRLPAVLYGPETKPVMLSLDTSDLQGILRKTTSDNVILNLQIESERGQDNKTVLIKELQMDPIKDRIIHADLYEISMDREITFKLPIHLVNTPLGVTEGGILQQVRRELTITCLPSHLMEHIDVDVSGLDIGGSIHIRDIRLPSEIKCIDEDHETVAVVTAPAVAVEEAPEEEMEEEAAPPESED